MGLNLLFANFEMGGKMAGGEVSSIWQYMLGIHVRIENITVLNSFLALFKTSLFFTTKAPTGSQQKYMCTSIKFGDHWPFGREQNQVQSVNPGPDRPL